MKPTTQQIILSILRLVETQAMHYYVIKRALKTTKDCQSLSIALSIMIERGLITDNEGLYTITEIGKSFLTGEIDRVLVEILTALYFSRYNKLLIHDLYNKVAAKFNELNEKVLNNSLNALSAMSCITYDETEGYIHLTIDGIDFLNYIKRTQPTPTPTPEKTLALAELTTYSLKQIKIAGELIDRDNTTEANKTLNNLITTYTTLANALPSPGQCAYCINIANLIKGYYPLELNHEELDDLIETLEAQG